VLPIARFTPQMCLLGPQHLVGQSRPAVVAHDANRASSYERSEGRPTGPLLRPVLRPPQRAAAELNSNFVFEVFLQPTAQLVVVRMAMDSPGV